MHSVLPDLVIVTGLMASFAVLWAVEARSKKPTHGCTREQAARSTNQSR